MAILVVDRAADGRREGGDLPAQLRLLGLQLAYAGMPAQVPCAFTLQLGGAGCALLQQSFDGLVAEHLRYVEDGHLRDRPPLLLGGNAGGAGVIGSGVQLYEAGRGDRARHGGVRSLAGVCGADEPCRSRIVGQGALRLLQPQLCSRQLAREEVARICGAVELPLKVRLDELAGVGIGDPRGELRVGALERDTGHAGIARQFDGEMLLEQPQGRFPDARGSGCGRRLLRQRNLHRVKEGGIAEQLQPLRHADRERPAPQHVRLGLEKALRIGIAGLRLHLGAFQHAIGFLVDLDAGGCDIFGADQQRHDQAAKQCRC